MKSESCLKMRTTFRFKTTDERGGEKINNEEKGNRRTPFSATLKLI